MYISVYFYLIPSLISSIVEITCVVGHKKESFMTIQTANIYTCIHAYLVERMAIHHWILTLLWNGSGKNVENLYHIPKPNSKKSCELPLFIWM